MSLNSPQPHPINPTGPEIFSLVIADIKERDALGRKHYGGDLRAIDGRDHLIDLYQEILDAAVYIRQEIEERIILRAEIERLKGLLNAERERCACVAENFRNSMASGFSVRYSGEIARKIRNP